MGRAGLKAVVGGRGDELEVGVSRDKRSIQV